MLWGGADKVRPGKRVDDATSVVCLIADLLSGYWANMLQ